MIDFHAHLDLYPNPSAVIEEIIKNKMYVLSVTNTPSAWIGTSSIARHYSRIRTALGLHPQLAHKRFTELSIFDGFINETNYVGEIGLDGGVEFKEHIDRQKFVFKHILSTSSRSGGKVLSIHSLRAADAVIEILSNYPNAGIPVLHWFTGSKSELDRALKIGCWFSVGPAMLKSQKSKELIKNIPKNRVLTESDGPFAKIDGKIVMPWDVSNAVSGLGDLWGVSDLEANEIIISNFKTLVS